MADAPNTVSTLNGLFKTVYAKQLEDLVPDFAILQSKVKFEGDSELGSLYAQPVNLSHEAGFTYGGETGADSTGLLALSLNDAVAGSMKEAQVKGSELVLRSQILYKALAAASSTKNEKAFRKATGWKVEDMNNSMRKRLEIAMLYGQKGIATVSSLSSQDITITDASWAGGIWAGSENAYIDVFQSDLSTVRQAGLKVSAVNFDTKVVTVVGTTTGIASTDVVFFKGALASGGAFSEMAGLHKIITNTGTLFGISAASFSMWKGTTVTSVGQISFAKLADAVAKAANKGLMEKVLCLLSPRAYGVLNSDQAALRVYGAESSKGKNGFESLVFHSANGQIEIVAHPMVKEGDAFLVPESALMRIGAADVTFGIPGMQEEFFSLVPAKNAVELQCYTDQAIFLERPAHAVHMSGITY